MHSANEEALWEKRKKKLISLHGSVDLGEGSQKREIIFEEASLTRSPAPKSTAGFAPRVELDTNAARKVQDSKPLFIKTRAQAEFDKVTGVN